MLCMAEACEDASHNSPVNSSAQGKPHPHVGLRPKKPQKAHHGPAPVVIIVSPKFATDATPAIRLVDVRNSDNLAAAQVVCIPLLQL